MIKGLGLAGPHLTVLVVDAEGRVIDACRDICPGACDLLRKSIGAPLAGDSAEEVVTRRYTACMNRVMP